MRLLSLTDGGFAEVFGGDFSGQIGAHQHVHVHFQQVFDDIRDQPNTPIISDRQTLQKGAEPVNFYGHSFSCLLRRRTSWQNGSTWQGPFRFR